jgi:hypothetical protein
MPIHAARDKWKTISHSHFSKVKGSVMRHPAIMIGVITASGENRVRKTLPPRVKAVHVKALMRMRESP